MKNEDKRYTSDIRIITIDLDVGEISPWHLHTELTENIRCLVGIIKVQYAACGQFIVLYPGQEYEIAPGVTHNLVNLSSEKSTYLLHQEGRYDFVICK